MNQHYVSRFLIENFADITTPGNRGVWVYRRSDQKWSKRPTRKTAALEDFYTLIGQSGERDDTLEEFMERIETQVAPVIRGGVELRRRLSPPQPYDVFVTFCALLICRNPTTIERTKRALLKLVLSELETDLSTPESFQALRTAFQKSEGKEFPNFKEPLELLRSFRFNVTHETGVGISVIAVEPLIEQMGRSQVTFLCAPDGLAFITADVPYFIESSDAGDIECVCVPLSPRTVALFSPHSVPKYLYLDLAAHQVEAINARMLTGAIDFIISSSPTVLTPDTLCAWASAAGSV